MAPYLLLGFAILALIGIPIAIALGLSASIVLFFTDYVSVNIIIQRLTNGSAKFILLSIPFFILAGKLMNAGEITQRIFKFADALVGHIPGGLGHTNVMASIIFAGMSGSAVADAGGLGTIELKAMKEKGYDVGFRSSITIASSIIGPIIPPSIPMVVYGVIAQVSAGRLFLGGIVPGLLAGLSLMLLIYFQAKKNEETSQPRASFIEIWTSAKEAFLSLLTPIIIVGGIIAGVFTPTEAAVIASVYALFLGFVVYRTLTIRELKKVLIETLVTSSTIIFIIAFADSFAWLLNLDGAGEWAIKIISSISTNPNVILLLLNVFFLIVGMFMESLSIIVIITPVVLPLVRTLGIDPVHFGVVLVLNLMIGLATPPFGLSLFTVAKIENIETERLFKPILPYIVPLVITLLLVTYFPNLVLFLPRVLMGLR